MNTVELKGLLVKGNQPWAPAKDCMAIDAWHRWNGIPLIGTVVVNDELVLFASTDGTNETSRWLYAPVSESDAEAAFAAVKESNGFYYDALYGYLLTSRVIIAVTDDFELDRWVEVVLEDSIPKTFDDIFPVPKEEAAKQ